jgi:hypothetical protein
MKILKIRYFINVYRKIIIFLLCVSMILGVYLLTNKVNVANKLNETMLGIIGTLFGAIIGGTFSLLGSVYVNNKQIRASAEVKRKNIIYKPLYDELLEIKKIITVDNPYPTYVTFEKGPQTMCPHPQFSAWGRIKSDSRIIETPKCIRKQFEELYDILDKYQDYRYKSSEDIQKKINEILPKYNMHCKIRNLGDVISANVILRNIEYGKLIKEYPIVDSKETEINEEQWATIDRDIYEECSELKSVKEIISIFDSWKFKQDQIIETLETLIKIVNIKYDKIGV